MAKNIKVGIKLDKSGFQKELNQLLKGNYNIKLDSGNFKSTINELNKEINRLKTQMNSMGSTNIINTSDITKATSETKKLADQMANLREKSQIRIANDDSKWQLAQAKAVNKALDEQYALQQKQAQQRQKQEQDYDNLWQRLLKNREIREQQAIEKRQQAEQNYNNLWQRLLKERELAEQQSTQRQINNLNNLKTQLQGKLTTASNNNLIDTSYIDKLQTKLNSITTNSSEKEIKELQIAINNLSSTDNGIVRLQSAITRLQEKIANIKNSKIDLVNSNEIGEIRQVEDEITKLRNMLSSLKSGESIIDGKAISNQINVANSSVRNLQGSMTQLNATGGALANTFKEVFSYALGGSAFYAAMNSLRGAASEIISLDDAMRDLKRVSDESSETYSNFTRVANSTAIALGSTTVGAIEATTTFKALGYSFQESSEYLSQMAQILSNVGDMSASDAASSLVSILKGFRLEAEDTTQILDVLNEAG